MIRRLGAIITAIAVLPLVLCANTQATPLTSPLLVGHGSPTTTIASYPWRAYWTSVNPGSGIDFATAQVGWRLDGQPGSPRIDDNLGSGVFDNGSAWPGTSISATDDGGKTWSTILRIPTGIWGLDLVSTQVGYAVGVTALSRTTNGGKGWTPVNEPASHTLVWVGFTSSTHGYGLTTTGVLEQTGDGGLSWTRTGLGAVGTAACFVSSSTGYVTNNLGALYATHDGGGSWSIVRRGPPRVEQFVGPWSDLSCDGSNVWVGLRLFCAAACGASSPYLVSHSANGGSTWSTSSSDWLPTSMPTAPVAYLATVGAGAVDGGILVDLPTENSPPPTQDDLRVLVVRAAGGAYTDAKIPALPDSFSVAGNYVNVRGVAFVGSTGWLYFNYMHAGTASRPLAEPIVWRTTNGGSRWRVLTTGPKEAPL